MNTERIKQVLRSRSVAGIAVSIVVMAITAFAYFYPDASQHNVLRQHDMQQGAAIGQEVKAYYEATGESSRWTGSLFSGMPNFQISPSYPSDNLHKWINSVMGLGLPEPANLLFMMMAGMFILLLAMKMRWWVALIGAIAYGFSSYFIIIIGAGHLWKFITLAYIPPTIAGVVLCYRGKYLAGGALAALFGMMQISSNHVQMTYYFMFVILGFMVAYLITALKEKKTAQWLKATGVLAVAGVLAVCANLPSLYYTYEYSKESMRGGHSELTHAADASNTTSGLDRDYITQYSYGASETFSLLIPDIKGGASVKPEKGDSKLLTLADEDATKELIKKGELSADEAQYLQYLSRYFGEPEGTNGPVYVGALICALFLLGCVVVRGPLRWALVVLTVLSVLLALGRNCMWLTNLMIDYMPMYSKFRTVESILVIAEFTMPLLAVMALQQVLCTGDASEAWKQYRKPVLWSFGIVLGLCLVGIIFPQLYGSLISENDRAMDAQFAQYLLSQGADAQLVQMFSLNNPRIYAAVESVRSGMVESDAMRSFMIAGAGFGLLLLYFFKKLNVGVVAVLTGVVVCGDLFMVNKRYLNTDSFVPRRLANGPMFVPTPADQLIMADTTQNFRVLNMPEFWQARPSYFYKNLGGYHAAKLTRYQDLIDSYLQPFVSGRGGDGEWNVVNMLNARYIVDHNGQPLQNPEAMGNAWIVDEVKYVDGADAEMAALGNINVASTAVADAKYREILGGGTPKMPGDTIYETSYAPNRLTYHTSSAKGGVAVLSEIYFPWGWHATVDGQETEIGRVNYMLRAVRIPAGKHTLELRYEPQSLKTTTATAYAAIIAIYLLVIGAVAVWCVKVYKGKE